MNGRKEISRIAWGINPAREKALSDEEQESLRPLNEPGGSAPQEPRRAARNERRLRLIQEFISLLELETDPREVLEGSRREK